jgi:hypothetical protein
METMMTEAAAAQGLSQDFLLRLTSSQSTLYAALVALLGGAEGANDVLQEIAAPESPGDMGALLSE